MANDRLIDLSWQLSATTPVYPGDPAFRLEDQVVAAEAMGFNLKVLYTGMHVGTHADAPRHYYENGIGAAAVSLESMVGRTVLLPVEPHNGIVRTADLEKAWEGLGERQPRILVSTGFSSHFGQPDYFTDYPGFEPTLAAFLKARGAVLFGIDLPSVKYGAADNASAHADLLAAGIVIVENLTRLETLPAAFFFAAAMLPLVGSDGSPVRAFAIVDPFLDI
ncbi:MAG: cyclase family protein [bacterium]